LDNRRDSLDLGAHRRQLGGSLSAFTDECHARHGRREIPVKRFTTMIMMVCLAAAARPASAQVHGALTDAAVVPVNGRLGGTYLQFDQSSATLSGQLRMSFYQGFDFGFQGGLSRISANDNTRTSVRLGGDFRGQLAVQGPKFPLTVALGGALDVESADDFTILSVGPELDFSRTIDDAGKWLWYGSASLLISRYDSGPAHDNDTSFPVRGGMEFRPTPDLRLLAEMQVAVSDAVRDDVSFTFGVLFPF
jgi:hypothetical protein